MFRDESVEVSDLQFRCHSRRDTQDTPRNPQEDGEDQRPPTATGPARTTTGGARSETEVDTSRRDLDTVEEKRIPG